MQKEKAKEVCHVGFTATDGDRQRVNIVMKFLDGLGVSTRHWRIVDHDTLDLNNFARVNQGRDFLAERHEYEFVLLHFLYRPSNFGPPDDYHPELRTSPLSNWGTWRSRLKQTKAKYIFPFGGSTEISGSYVSLLEGYQLYGPINSVAFRQGGFDSIADFWCLARNDMPQPKASETLRRYSPMTERVA